MGEGKDRNCIFCKIIDGMIKSEPVYSDENVIVIKDIYPKAPLHLLIIPKKHIPTLNDVNDETIPVILFDTVKKIAKMFNVAETGYRLIINCNAMGGQSVYHIHMHFIAGKQMLGF